MILKKNGGGDEGTWKLRCCESVLGQGLLSLICLLGGGVQMGLDEGWVGRPQFRIKGSDAVIINIRKKKMLTGSR